MISILVTLGGGYRLCHDWAASRPFVLHAGSGARLPLEGMVRGAEWARAARDWHQAHYQPELEKLEPVWGDLFRSVRHAFEVWEREAAFRSGWSAA